MNQIAINCSNVIAKPISVQLGALLNSEPDVPDGAILTESELYYLLTENEQFYLIPE